MDKKLILKQFKDIGFTSYEVKCYLSLLQRDTLTVAEISRLAAIPRPNAYEALEKLMTKGLCVTRPGATKQYSASDPSLLADKLLMELQQEAETEMDDLKEDFERRLKKKEKEIVERTQTITQNVRKLIAELRPQYDKSRLETNPLDYIEIIKDHYQMHKRFMQLVAKTKSEILAFVKPPYSGSKEQLQEQTDQQIEPLQKGIRIKSIYEIPKNKEEREWWLRNIESAISHGEEARAIEELPMKMAIFDSKIVIQTLEDPISGPSSLTTQVIQHRSLARGLSMLFESVWQHAKDYRTFENL